MQMQVSVRQQAFPVACTVTICKCTKFHLAHGNTLWDAVCYSARCDVDTLEVGHRDIKSYSYLYVHSFYAGETSIHEFLLICAACTVILGSMYLCHLCQ